MADIVLKDRSGSPVEYPGVERIKVNTVDGEAVEFVDSATIPEVLENLPIALDFSGGNQTIAAPDGQVVKSAIIQQPANLIPENIAEGVDIAGIIGTFAGGGGCAFAAGTFTGNGGVFVLEHGLGVAPDFIYVIAALNATTGKYIGSGVGMSKEVKDAGGFSSYGKIQQVGASVSDMTQTRTIDEVYAASFFNSANENTITIGKEHATYYCYTYNCDYHWLAIGGLT